MVSRNEVKKMINSVAEKPVSAGFIQTVTAMINEGIKKSISHLVKEAENHHDHLNKLREKMGIPPKKRMHADIFIHNSIKIQNLLPIPEREEVESERKIESSTNKIEVNNHERQEG